MCIHLVDAGYTCIIYDLATLFTEDLVRSMEINNNQMLGDFELSQH